MDGKEATQNVLSVNLSLCMESNKLINLLRKEIVNGKLGKFKVAAFPDKLEGLFLTYSILKLYLFN